MNFLKVKEKSLNKKRDNYLEEFIKDAERDLAFDGVQINIKDEDLISNFPFLDTIEIDFPNFNEYYSSRDLNICLNKYLINRVKKDKSYQDELSRIKKNLPAIIQFIYNRIIILKNSNKKVDLVKFKKIDEDSMSNFLKCFKGDYGNKVLDLLKKHNIINPYSYEFIGFEKNNKYAVAVLFGKLNQLGVMDEVYISKRTFKYTIYESLEAVFSFKYSEGNFNTNYNDTVHGRTKYKQYFDSLSFLNTLKE